MKILYLKQIIKYIWIKLKNVHAKLKLLYLMWILINKINKIKFISVYLLRDKIQQAKFKNQFYLYIASLFFIFLLISCNNEYIDFHLQKYLYTDKKNEVWNYYKNFDLNKIEERNFEIHITPDKTLLDNIVNYINNANKKIYLEVYILTEKRIIKALKDAFSRWVDVKIVLEKNVYWSPTINRSSFEEIKKYGIPIVYASEDNFIFTHSKLFIIDDFYFLWTWNMTYSTFTTNKEFFIKWNNKQDLYDLEQIFLNDFNHTIYFTCNTNLILSPDCSRFKLEFILKNAKKSIYIYTQSMDDSEIKKILLNKKQENIDIRLILWDKEKVKSNVEIIKLLKLNQIKYVSPKKPYIHAKVFIVDEKYIYIWSVNFTKNSMDNNREIGFVFINNEIVDKMTKLFLQDFNLLQ